MFFRNCFIFVLFAITMVTSASSAEEPMITARQNFHMARVVKGKDGHLYSVPIKDIEYLTAVTYEDVSYFGGNLLSGRVRLEDCTPELRRMVLHMNELNDMQAWTTARRSELCWLIEDLHRTAKDAHREVLARRAGVRALDRAVEALRRAELLIGQVEALGRIFWSRNARLTKLLHRVASKL